MRSDSAQYSKCGLTIDLYRVNRTALLLAYYATDHSQSSVCLCVRLQALFSYFEILCKEDS